MQLAIATDPTPSSPRDEGKLVYVVAGIQGAVVLIGFRHDLTNGAIDEFQLPLRETSSKYLDRLTEVGRGLLQRLSMVEGVKKVWLDRNDMHLTLGYAYRWRGDLAFLVKEKIAFVAVDNKLTAAERRKRKPKAPKVAVSDS